jgi:plastocyanin
LKRSVHSILGIAALLTVVLAVPSARALDGPQANATVSFGLWKSDPALDRFPNASPRSGMANAVIPSQVTIKAGGGVNFIISGFHQVVVYDAGTQPHQIDAANQIVTTGANPNPPVPLINDPANRIYRGPDPSLQPLDQAGAFNQDRVEVVQLSKPGTYLVICGIHPHFVNAGMFGFVKVVP